MHPIFIFAFIASATWFLAVAAMAGRGVGARVGLAVLGIVEFGVVTAILTKIMESQGFFRQAVRSGPDIGPITLYIVAPTVVIVFLTGLGLKKALSRPTPTDA